MSKAESTEGECSPFQNSSVEPIELSEKDKKSLEEQNTRLVPTFRAEKFQKEQKKHWDLFYKRNTDKFFKDRHWTTREFSELAKLREVTTGDDDRVLFEVGCGVGNFVFPLAEEFQRLLYYACDISPRAVELVKSNALYAKANGRIKAFQWDITSGVDTLPDDLRKADILSLIFVLSALRPSDFLPSFKTLAECMKSGGVLIFRDYAVNDMAMVRFGKGHKIAERLYLRQDGTTSYFFTIEEINSLAEEAGFKVEKLEYVHRKTINLKEEVNVPRVFVQGQLRKL